jgi:hypothetical protein
MAPTARALEPRPRHTLFHPAGIERDRSSAHEAHEFAVVRSHEHSRAACIDLAQQIHDFERQVRIQIPGRFIREE